jgi:hypothetical protein
MAFLSQTSISRSASEFSFSPAPLQREDNTQLELEYDKTFVLEFAVGHEWDNIQTAKQDAKAWIMDKGSLPRSNRTALSFSPFPCSWHSASATTTQALIFSTIRFLSFEKYT